jgi:hypothetical protein
MGWARLTRRQLLTSSAGQVWVWIRKSEMGGFVAAAAAGDFVSVRDQRGPEPPRARMWKQRPGRTLG